jgi:hypothetical protein
VKRPTVKDFSLDDEEEMGSPHRNNTTIVVNDSIFNIDPLSRNGTSVLTHEKARIGVHFQLDELSVAKFRKLLKGNNGGQKMSINMMSLRAQVINTGRLEKWFKMVTY